MEALFKRVVYLDEWIKINENLTLGTSFEFEQYALGWRWEATPREIEIIETNKMWRHPAITLRTDEGYFCFANVLGPQFIPEVNGSQEALLRIQSMVTARAVQWTIFFETMDDPRA